MKQNPGQVDIVPPSEGFSFRNAEVRDLEFIYKLILEGAANGHFANAFLTPQGSKGLKLNLVSILTHKRRLDSDMPAYGVIYHEDGKSVGFIINTSIYDSKGTEIWMMAIHRSYRGSGCGSALLDEILRHMVGYNGLIMARCHPSSNIMYNMLVKRGFEHKDTGKEGTRILVK
ncbi:MAG: GNAT family N-acetyltransferase [Janthinobacterium lividum]